MSWWSAGGRADPDLVPEPDRDRDLVLYRRDGCGYCWRVESVIAELGLAIPVRDTWRDPGAREELRERTGRTQVPCLFVDGQPLLESRDIAAWLRRYAARSTAP